MAGRKERNIKIREQRNSKLDDTKMQVAVWLIAKGLVEERTDRPQPVPKLSADDSPLDFEADPDSEQEAA